MKTSIIHVRPNALNVVHNQNVIIKFDQSIQQHFTALNINSGSFFFTDATARVCFELNFAKSRAHYVDVVCKCERTNLKSYFVKFGG